MIIYGGSSDCLLCAMLTNPFVIRTAYLESFKAVQYSGDNISGWGLFNE